MSAYLDRLISVHEEDYTFRAKMYMIFSWLDPRAPALLKEGTDEMIENNGECAKPCSGQRMLEGDPTAGTCCTKVWAPAALFRNVLEFPESRTQPYVFYVSPDGRVSYRVEINGEYYSPLQLRAYPLDTQDLRVVIVYTNFNPNMSNGAWRRVAMAGSERSFRRTPFTSPPSPLPPPHPTHPSPVSFVPSASGSKLFTFGEGDDLSGYQVTDVFVQTRNGLWSDQFARGPRAPSARADPLPVSPAARTADALAAAQVAAGNASVTLTPAKKFGTDYTVSETIVRSVCVCVKHVDEERAALHASLTPPPTH